MLVQLFGMPTETEKAYCCDINTGATTLNLRQHYLPKSIVKIVSADGIDYHGGINWFARKQLLRRTATVEVRNITA